MATRAKLPSGATLHTDLLDEGLQIQIEQWIEDQLVLGRAGKLGRTYMSPSTQWMELQKSREMLQYGVYTNSNRVQGSVKVLSLPPELLNVLDLLKTASVFTEMTMADTCTINVYSEGMWLPPHVDSDMFARPFCTVSLLSDQDVVFGDEISGDNGEFEGEYRVRMPKGSALRLDGDASGPVCKHAIPKVSCRRISLTFRRLSEATKRQIVVDEQEKEERLQQRIAAKRAAKAKLK
eukprot:m.19346 g.19346  ORF g.19346 m.19346 type:complete len:236 (+) comp12422_c1_seq1:205-912(+)